MRWNKLAVAVGLLFVAACTETPTQPTNDLMPQLARGGNGVVHHVSAGGSDICEAIGLPTGCDANWSMVANQKADGSVSGQWEDSFGHGNGGFHMEIDCLSVDGNTAIFGGVITHAWGLAEGDEGVRAVGAVVDNGTSKKDPPDQISPTVAASGDPVGPGDCGVTIEDFQNAGILLDLTHGQVTVR